MVFAVFETAIADSDRVVELFRGDGGGVLGALPADQLAAAAAVVFPPTEPEGCVAPATQIGNCHE